MVFRVRLDRHFESFWLHFQGQSALQTGLETQAETCRLSDAIFHGFWEDSGTRNATKIGSEKQSKSVW